MPMLLAELHSAIDTQLDTLANTASRGCGQSYALYVDRFSSAVDGALAKAADDYRELALCLAVAYGYATPAARLVEAHTHSDTCCSHGIEFDACPVGCGDARAEATFVAEDYAVAEQA